MIRTTAVAVLLAASLPAFASEQAPAKLDLAKAKEIAEGLCVACHGADGNSPAEIYAALKAPKLAGQVPEYITKSLHDFKAGRRSNEVMSPQAQAVAEVDMADIAAWFSSQKVQPNKAQNTELLAQGERIFFKGKGRPDVIAACVGCHGLNGVGNRDWAKTMSNVPAVLAPALRSALCAKGCDVISPLLTRAQQRDLWEPAIRIPAESARKNASVATPPQHCPRRAASGKRTSQAAGTDA